MPTASTIAQATAAPRLAGIQKAASRPDGDDNEYDLDAFDDDRLAGGGSRQPVETGVLPLRFLAQVRYLPVEGARFIAPIENSRGAQNCLAQPAQAKQQEKNADQKLKHTERRAVDRRAEDQNNDDENRQSGDRAERRRAPAANRGDREHDGEGLHHFDKRGEERSRDRGAGGGPGGHAKSSHDEGAARGRRSASVADGETVWSERGHAC